VYILPIIDLWIGRPAAYALTDDKGNMTCASSPRQLYANIFEAMCRDFNPLIVRKPKNMEVIAWQSFVHTLPLETIWVYDDGEVKNLVGDVKMKECRDWAVNVANHQEMKILMEQGVHFGSGPGIVGVDELRVSESSLYEIQWGR